MIAHAVSVTGISIRCGDVAYVFVNNIYIIPFATCFALFIFFVYPICAEIRRNIHTLLSSRNRHRHAHEYSARSRHTLFVRPFKCAPRSKETHVSQCEHNCEGTRYLFLIDHVYWKYYNAHWGRQTTNNYDESYRLNATQNS